MANDHFKFKQFTIRQNRCAMKVTTIACIQGAWLPKIAPKKILDIGSGTGLLSLMMAQQLPGQIDAVEIGQDAFSQLSENITQSPWADRISCHHDNIIKFADRAHKKYDFIISNPPFFSGHLPSPDQKINYARHEKGLKIHELTQIVDQLLSDDGMASIMLPPVETNEFIKLMSAVSLYPSAQLLISDSIIKQPNAIVTLMKRNKTDINEHNFFIKNSDGTYSSEFISLLKPYYLYL